MTTAIPAVFMRGGTSKGLFFHAQDLPPAGSERDELLLRLMGSPDALQIDGMGGGASSTSKVIVVEPYENNTVKYWFAQVGIAERVVDWSGNCGNLTTAVAPFAIDEGVAAVADGIAKIRLLNANTGVEIEAELYVQNGKAVTTGDFAIAGVPGTAAPIATNYMNPAGAVLGSLLPLGEAETIFETSFGSVAASLVDATNPYLFVRRDLIVDQNVPLALTQIEELRAAAAVAAGAAPDAATSWREHPTVPRVVLVAPNENTDSENTDSDIETTTISMGQVHRGIPMTAALALAAARAVPGSIVAQIAGEHHGVECETRISHPLGITSVHARVTQAGELESVGVTRTARALMRGEVFAPNATPLC